MSGAKTSSLASFELLEEGLSGFNLRVRVNLGMEVNSNNGSLAEKGVIPFVWCKAQVMDIKENDKNKEAKSTKRARERERSVKE
ncbi:hypothetical protein Tco_0598872 [Tanacetum coccineum]